MYLSKTERAMLEATFFNLVYDMDCIGLDTEMWEDLAAMSDRELEAAINDYLAAA